MKKFRAAWLPAILLAISSNSLLIASDGLITTIAGDGRSGSLGTGIPATSAQITNPGGICQDVSGDLFIADSGNNRVVRVDAVSGYLTLVAGNGTAASSGDGGPATQASLHSPVAVVLDGAGNLYISELAGYRIRRVDAQTGVITTVVGTGTSGFSGDGGPAVSAAVGIVFGLALDSAGNLYLADESNNRVRRVDATSKIITTVAGNGTNAFTADGAIAAGASLTQPFGVAFDLSGGLLISEMGAHRVRRVDPVSGVLTTVAGNGAAGFTGDGVLATSAGIGLPTGLFVDASGNLFVGDGTGRVRRVDAATGWITTVAGNGTGAQGAAAAAGPTAGIMCYNSAIGDGGPATNATFDAPFDVLLTAAGNLLVSDQLDCRVRQVDLPSPYAYTSTVLTTSATVFQSGQKALLTATVSPIGTSGVPTGSVQFVDEYPANGATLLGAAPLNGGTALMMLAVSQSHQVMAIYSGDSSFNGSGSPEIALSVSSAAKTVATIALSTSQNSAAAGTSVVFTATVTGPSGAPSAPAGPVQLLDGSTLVATANLVNGVAALPATFTTAGSHAMTATYLGSNTYSQVTSASVTETVTNSASVSLTSGAPSATYGQSIPFTVSVVPSTATGTVQLIVDGSAISGSATLASGTAAISISTLTAGSHTIAASYSGDGYNSPATSAALTQAVVQATPAFTITSSLNPSAVGQAVTLTVTMTPASSGSALGLTIGNPPATLNAVWSGTGTTLTTSITTSDLSAGAHTVTGVWGGDANVAAGSSAVLTQTVQATTSPTTTTLVSSPNPSVYGTAVTLTATVTPATATGLVGFTANSVPVGAANLVNGQVQVSVTNLPAGSISLVAQYAGDANDAYSKSATVTQIVTQGMTPSTLTLTSSANPSVAGQALSLTAAVSPVTATGTVQFLDGSTSLGTVAITGGSATLSISSLSVGTHSITASYGGDTNDTGSTSAALVQTVSTPPSFTLAANPSGLTIAQGGAGTTTITVIGLGGFTGSVSLAASGLPSGVTASFSPNPTTGSSVLRLAASATAAVGMATLTITGNAAGVPNATAKTVLLVTTPVSVPNEWTWMGGSSTVPSAGSGHAGVYGTLGAPAAGNIPGGREWASSWTDSGGNLWLFGGFGSDYDAWGYLNDVWEFNPSTNEWAWMGGPESGSGHAGVYGTLGVPAAGNIPGGRQAAARWTDSGGHLWLFGGGGADANANQGYLNDLWEFNPSTNQWAWMGGSSTVTSGFGGQAGVYGEKGVFAAGNIPGGRQDASSWTDSSGHVWLHGGLGADANGTSGYLNDLWEFDPSTNQWAWVGGNKTVPCSHCGQPGVYGSLGVPAAGSAPGSRYGASNWTDGSGHLWLFGGYGYDARGLPGSLNDLWEFDPSTNQWVWVGGSSTVPRSGGGNPGVYGTLDVLAAGNIPGGRSDALNWIDGSGHLWLLGGLGTDANDTAGSLNDLWVLDLSTNEWAWMGGGSTVPVTPPGAGNPGVYGSLGVPAAGRIPGGRNAASTWIDSSGHFWLFGGLGYDANDARGYLNDLWEYQPSAPAIPTFTLSANPNNLTIAQGASATSAVTVTGSGGFTGSVTLAASGLPGGVTASFSPNPTTGTSAITLTASSSAAPGSYSPAITGTSATLTATAGLALTIAPGSVSTTTTLSSSPNPSTFGQSVTFTASVSPMTATGNVQFFDGATSLGTATLAGGSAGLAVSTLAVGTHAITAAYTGDASDLSSTSTTLEQAVNKVTSSVTLTSSTNPSTFGQAVMVSAAITPSAATGSVQFLDGATVLGTVTITGGAASLSLTTLSVGAHSITAVYSGDANDATSTSAALSQTVNKTSSNVVVTSSPNPSTSGQTVNLAAAVTPSAAAGTVQFLDGATVLGTASISGGAAVLSLSTLSVGAHSITAVYGGDGNDAASTPAVLSQSVSKIASSVALASSANPSTIGHSVTFTASVTPSTATGTVQFLDGATALGTVTISGGAAVLSLSTLSVGAHSITAVYGGDGNDAAGTSAVLSQSVSKIASSVALTSSVNPSTIGHSVTFTATVTPSAATGTVQFLDGGTALGTVTIAGGSAALSLSTLSVGAHSITAVYGGDGSDAASTSAVLSQSVSKVVTSVALTSSLNPSTFGQSVTLSAKVTPSTGTGSVQFLDGATALGTATLSGGAAALSVSSLAAGSHSITAVYSGDGNDAAGTSAALAQTVNKATTTVALASSKNPQASGSSVTFTATVSPSAATGSVQFLDGSTALGAVTISGGKAALSLSSLSVGSHSITAVYSGDANYLTSKSAAVTESITGAACHVTYSVTNQWSGGFGTAITIQNTGTTAVSGWNLTWTWAGNQKITQSWASSYSQSGANAKLTNASYNAAIAAGASITGVGFNASYSGTNTNPTAFSLNGTLCK